MSLHFRQGYRLPADVDPFDFIDAAHEVLVPARRRADARILADVTAELIDKVVVTGGPEPMANPMVSAAHQWIQGQSSLPSHDSAKNPNRSRLLLGRDPESGCLAVIHQCDEPLQVEALASLPGVQPYGWVGAVFGRFDGVSETEWAEREAFWKRVARGHALPGLKMATWRGLDTYPAGMIAVAARDAGVVRAEFPTAEVRARRVAHEALRQVVGPRAVIRPEDHPALVDAARELIVDVDQGVLTGSRPIPAPVRANETRSDFWDAVAVAADEVRYVNRPRRYTLVVDQPDFGLDAGDVLLVYPEPRDTTVGAVERRDRDRYEPGCTVPWMLLRPVEDGA